jgi:gas vesicle protein
MLKNFTKGLVIGGLIGASISVLTNPDVMDPHMRKRMIKSGRKIVRRSNHVIGDMIDLFR